MGLEERDRRLAMLRVDPRHRRRAGHALGHEIAGKGIVQELVECNVCAESQGQMRDVQPLEAPKRKADWVWRVGYKIHIAVGAVARLAWMGHLG